MAFNYSPKILRDGLVVYLDAGNKKSYSETGTVWTDLTQNKYTAVKAGSQSPTYPLFNSSPGYFTFNGGLTNNPYGYFNIANIPSFSSLSVFAWYRTSETSTNKTIVRMDNSDFELSVNGSGTLFVSAGTNWNDVNVQVNQANSTNGLWHHIGLTFNGQVLIGYFDASQFGTITRGTVATTAAGTLRVGTRDDLAAHHFVGDISLIQIYNRVLSPTEILQNYNAMKSRFNLS